VILRNVLVACERARLRSTHAADLLPHTPDSTLREPSVEAQPTTAPSFTLDGVEDWLKGQPAEVRAACARSLAPEIHALAASERDAGRELGLAQGRQEALESAKSSLAALAQAAAAAERAFAVESTQLAESCAQIVAEVIRKLAGPALVSREAALGAVLEVLHRIRDERELTIRVSPRDLPFLETQRSAIQEALGTRSWSLCAEPRVSIGGCLIESSLGTLDGRLEIQLEGLLETLRAATSTAAGSA
jgi:flagellar assembly protein FliH